VTTQLQLFIIIIIIIIIISLFAGGPKPVRFFRTITTSRPLFPQETLMLLSLLALLLLKRSMQT